MSQWKLVEAEAVGTSGGAQKTNNTQQNKQFNNSNNNTSNNRGGNTNNRRYDNNNRGGNNGRRNNSNGKDNNRNRNSRGGNRRQHDIYIPDTPETRKQYAGMAVQLLEHYFSDDSLSCDTFVRSYFDTAGYIPIAFVCNFPDIVAIGAFYEDILAQLKDSEKFEIDEVNDTMRVKGWEKWLMPNAEGGFGVPRYIMAPVTTGSETDQVAQETTGEGGAEETTMRDRSGSKELSVTASEYVFNAPVAK